MALLETQLRSRLSERSDLLDEAAGIGLWEAVMPNADPAHPKATWTWSAEFRRLCGYRTEAEYPNVMQSWSDRLHPDDVQRVFTAFGSHLQDKTGATRYDVTLSAADAQWQLSLVPARPAAAVTSADGSVARACGSLSDVHAQTVAETAVAEEAARTAAIIGGLSERPQGSCRRQPHHPHHGKIFCAV